MNIVDILCDVLQFGLPYGILALGVFISYRVLDFADLTTEGTFVFGGSLAMLMIVLGVNPWIGTLVALIGGFGAGIITGLLHTKLRIPGLLSGIITMTGLFSINMVVLGLHKKGVSFKYMFDSRITLNPYEHNTIFTGFENLFKNTSLNNPRLWGIILALIVIVIIITTIVYLFFGTEFGMSMRATGMNPKMARAQGINTNMHIILGLGLSNALIALSSAIGAQRELTISNTSGTGMIVIGLASIIIGETIFGKKSFLNWIVSVVIGAMVYYLVIAIAIALGMPSHLLKLLYAVLIVFVLSFPLIKERFLKFYNREDRKYKRDKKREAKISFKSEQINEKINALEIELENADEDSKEKIKNNILKLQLKINKNEQIDVVNSFYVDLTVEESLTTEPTNHIMLSVQNVTKVFNPTGNPQDLKIALNDLSVDIHEGEFVTIIGGNGSGKSTFFNTVSGVYTPEAGKIFVDGTDVTKLKEHKKAYFIGRVAQDPYQGTAPNMSILENMSIAMRRDQKKTLKWGFNKKNTMLFMEKVASLGLGLEKRMTSKIGTLSGGQRQAVTLLMATLQKPKLLFLDEHTAALDPKTAKTVLMLTDKIVRENHLTAVMVTHNMRDAIKYGNRLLMFNNGKIIYDVKGEEKANLTVEDLLKKFEGQVEFSDKDILAN